MRLVRVKYGKKGIPKEMREYQINGFGAVGTLEEYKKVFPDEEFEIEDKIENN